MRNRIAFFVYELGGGGAERTAVVLANSFAERGKEVFVFSGPPKDNEYQLNKNIERVELYNNHSFLKDTITLRRYLNIYNIDVCIAVGIYPNLVASFANVLLKTRVIIYEQNAPKEDKLSRKTKLLRKILYRHADFYVFQTKEERDFYCKNIRERSKVIYNPLIDQLPKRVCTKKEIVAIGRLRPQKNYKLMIDAFSMIHPKHTDYVLRVYGKGTDEEILKKYVKDHGLENNVVFEGFTLDVHDAIKSSDIYVLSSDYEGMPNTLMEAMGMGFPVVSTDCAGGGPRTLIKDGENGLLVPVGDAVKFADAILKYIDNPLLKESCAKNATKIYDECGIDVIMNHWESLLYDATHIQTY